MDPQGGSPARGMRPAAVFRTLYAILDERKATYVQGTVQLVLDSSSAERLADQLKAMRLNVTIRDQ